MRGLAWDDEYNPDVENDKSYAALLQRSFRRWSLELVVTNSADRFVELYEQADWDLVITDLFDERDTIEGSEGDPSDGLTIARRAARAGIPTYLITKRFDLVDPTKFGLPSSVTVKSKSTKAGWMAKDIVDDLTARGLFRKREKVFLVEDSYSSSNRHFEAVASLVRNMGLQVVTANQANYQSQGFEVLVSAMQNCAAVVSVCSPDTLSTSETGSQEWGPSPFALLQIGISIGMPRGIERMTLLQVWGETVDTQARLPEFLDKIPTFQISGQGIAPHSSLLRARLQELGVVPPIPQKRASVKGTEQDSKQMDGNCRIVFFAANPSDTHALALDKEARSIEEKVRMSELRDRLYFRSKWAVRPDDLLQVLNEEDATVIHFSGHGSENEELALVGGNGETKPVTTEALCALFRVLRGSIRLVVLNACFSRYQAEAIIESVDCAIGMSQAIGDEAAVVFAASLYRAIGFGKSVQEAFDQGVAALMLEGIPESETPKLISRAGVDASEVFLVS